MEFEIVSVSIAVSDDEQLGAWDESPKHEVSRIYVCPDCAKTVSVTVGTEGLKVIPENHPSE